MKNFQKGSVVPYLVIIIAILLIVGAYFIYAQMSSNAQREQFIAPSPVVTMTSPTNPPVARPSNTQIPVVAVPPVTPMISSMVMPAGSHSIDSYKIIGSGFGNTSVVKITLISSPFTGVAFPKTYNDINPSAYTSSSLSFSFPSYSAGSPPGTYKVQVSNSNASGVTRLSNTETFAITPPTGI